MHIPINMAAPTNWFENPRNPHPRHQYFQQNQANQSFQRTPQQENSFQQLNPRFPHGLVQSQVQERPVLQHESPNFPPPNRFNMVQNVYGNDHGNTYPYNQRSNSEFSGHQNDREQTQLKVQPQMVSPSMPPPPFPMSSHITPPHFQNFNNNVRFGNLSHLNNEPQIPDAQDGWCQQMGADQSRMQQPNMQQPRMQPLDTLNQLNRPNHAFQDNVISLELEKLKKESYSPTIKYKLKQAEDDQMWLKHWLQNRQQKVNSAPKKKLMKICEAQEKTRQMIVLLARLQKNKQILETVKHEDRSIWEQKLKEVLSLKNELERVQKELTSEENARHLQAKVVQRRKKRERVKQHKKELYEQNNEMLAVRERKHADIDKAMQQLIEKQKLEKQEKDMQKEADEILSQVRKKLTEANRSVQLIDSLQKIRKLRTDRLERQGVLSMYESQGHGSTNRLMFEAKLSNMRDLLNKQLEIYKAEEAALKVHLETEQEETREKEREKTRLRMIERQKQERKKEEKMLFGNQKEPVPGDPLYPFRQYYDAASHSVDSLVAIRREWDSYLTSPGLGSCIPDTWVIPEEPVSELWGSALKHDQSS